MNAYVTEAVQAWRLQTEVLPTGERRHDQETWRQVRRLGNGTFGDVWQETCVSGPSRDSVRAVKQIAKRHGPISQRELEALVTFSNPRVPEFKDHFVSCYGWFEDPKHLYIAMEFVHHGDLQSHISRQVCSERETSIIIAQVAQALRYMHTHGYVHRDLKPLNILVSQPGPEWRVKLADFGISKSMDGTALKTLQVGTRGYMAPEVDDNTAESYTAAVDIWSLGAVAFCLRTGHPPFQTNRQLYDYADDRIQFPIQSIAYDSAMFANFVMRAMEQFPKRRLTIDQAIAHPWLSMNANGSQGSSHGSAPQSTQGTKPWERAASNAWTNTYASDASASTPSYGTAQTYSQNTTSPRGAVLPGASRHQPHHSQSWDTQPSNAWSNTYHGDATASTPNLRTSYPQGTAVPGEPPARPDPRHSQSWGVSSSSRENRYSNSGAAPNPMAPGMSATPSSRNSFTPNSTSSYGPPVAANSQPLAPPPANSWASRYAPSPNPNSSGPPQQGPPLTPGSSNAGSGYSVNSSSSGNTPYSSYGSAYQSPHPTNLTPAGPYMAYRNPVPAQSAESLARPLSANAGYQSPPTAAQGSGYGHQRSQSRVNEQPYGNPPTNFPQPQTASYVPQNAAPGYSQNPYRADTSQSRDGAASGAYGGAYQGAPAYQAPHNNDWTTQHRQEPVPSIDVTSSSDPPAAGSLDPKQVISSAFGADALNDPKLMETVEDAIRRIITPELEALRREQRERQSQVLAPEAASTPEVGGYGADVQTNWSTSVQTADRELGETKQQTTSTPHASEAGPQHTYADPSETCLHCGEWFAHRDGLFEHIEAEGHGVDLVTKKPEHYVRPEASRSWNQSYAASEPEEEESPVDSRYTCLKCKTRFNNRSDLFEHIETAGHAVNLTTGESESYARPESSRRIDDPSYRSAPSKGDSYLTCLSCHTRFSNRDDLFEHIETMGHAIDPVTGRKEKYRRPAAYRKPYQSTQPGMYERSSSPSRSYKYNVASNAPISPPLPYQGPGDPWSTTKKTGMFSRMKNKFGL